MIVGAIGDLHEPFTHPMYFRFVADTCNKHKVNHHVFIGDIGEANALSFHEHNPDGFSAGDEAQAAKPRIKRWYNAYKDADECIGNHDERHFRVGKKYGLPRRYLRDYNEIWDTPKWNWKFEHTIDGVLYTHGTGCSGKDAAINLAIQRRTSIVMGHIHSWAGVKWHCNATSRIFGMNCGCGIDNDAYAFDYGRAFPVRPVLGMGIVIDGDLALFVPMPCGRGEKYNRSRAGKRRRKR